MKEQRKESEKRQTAERLEDEIEQLVFENSAYETICQIMIANMAMFDIEKFKQQRFKTYSFVV